MTSSNTQLVGTVLIIDDQKTLLAVAQDMLTAKGMTVLTACSGQDGIQVFQKHAATIDVVLLDMKMPDLSGEKVFAELKAHDPGVQVILTTGYDEREALARFNGQQKITFIQKPYRFKVLIGLIAAILAKDRL